MKKLLFLFIVTTSVFESNAQKLEAGFAAAMQYEPRPLYEPFLPALSVRGYYNLSQALQLGFSAGLSTFSFTTYFEHPAYQVIGFSTIGAAYSARGIINMRRNYGIATVYSGLSLGYLSTFTADDFRLNWGLNSGFVAGVHGGLSIALLKRLGFNVEIGADYMNMDGRSDYNRRKNFTNLSKIMFPGTVGLRYLFGFSKTTKPATNDNK